MTTISVIIPSYNSFKTVSRTLDSLLARPAALLKEVIVVDSSDDGKTFLEFEKFRSEKLQIIRLSEKTMPAVGRNVGAGRATGEVLAFTDADAYVAADWLETIAEAFAAGCRMGGGAVLLPDFQMQTPLAIAQYFLQFNEFMPHGIRREVKFTPSVNLFCEKKLFDEVGGFPQLRASEDVLFGLKAASFAKFYFDPAIKVYHIFREEKESFLANQKILGEYILVYRRLHYKKFIYRGLWPFFLLPVLLPVKFFRIFVRVTASGDRYFIFSFFRNLPLFLEGLGAWSAGFVRACFSACGTGLPSGQGRAAIIGRKNGDVS